MPVCACFVNAHPPQVSGTPQQQHRRVHVFAHVSVTAHALYVGQQHLVS